MSEAATEPLTETQTADLDALSEGAPRVGIIAPSRGAMAVLERAGVVLDEHGVRYETRVLAPQTEPEAVADYCANARMRGLRVIIAGADLGAGLPAAAAVHSDLPVIGVPLGSALGLAGGLDAILAVTQQPVGAPVAAVGLDNPHNAAHLALRILRA